jgi:flagellin-like hook-associated protein FlgL
MSSIQPISSSRVSDLSVSQRLVSQLETDQSDLLKLETQISSGQSLTIPSDDPAAAQRALQLKQVIQQNTQYQTNVTSNQAYMSATDSALSSINSVINNIQSVADSVSSSTATDDQRTAAAEQISQAVSQLVDIGNQKFNGRYLFGGTETSTPPFVSNGKFVQYNGNEQSLSSYSDLNQLFSTNVDGNAAFGTLSAGVQGSSDLNPVVSASTPLADLNSGQGIPKGSIAIRDGSGTSIVDLSGAATLGDVAELIEAHPPAGRTVTVGITSTGLTVSLDAAGGGQLSIGEVGGGTTATALGIRQDTGASLQVVGSDLNPSLTTTTSLSDILGVKANALVTSGGQNNDLEFTATQPSAASNGVTVSFVDNPAINEGAETVAYDPALKTLTFQIDAGHTTASDIVKALNNDPTAGAAFQAQLVHEDTSNPQQAGTGVVDATSTAVTAGGSGAALDTSGLQIASGGTTYNISFAQDKTVQDVLNSINGAGAGVIASINSQGTGINIQSKLSGADFSIGENGGTTAAQLGVRSLTTATSLSDLNLGLGINPIGNGTPDFEIQRPDGSVLPVSVGGAQTIGDVLNLINNDPANQDPANKITAQLSTIGNGIQLTTASGSGSFQVVEENASLVAQQLGLVPAGATTSAAASVAGPTATITGSDPNPQQVSGVFNTLLDLQNALETNDQPNLQRSLSLLGQDSKRTSLAQSELGVQEQALAATQSTLQTNATTLQSQLSQNVDVDLTQAISDLTGRQTAFQAALQTTADISKLTLLNYL